MSKFKEFLQNEAAPKMPNPKLGVVPNVSSALQTNPLGWNIPNLHQYQKRNPTSGHQSFTGIAQAHAFENDRDLKMYQRLGDFSRAVAGSWEENPRPNQSEYKVLAVDNSRKMIYGIIKKLGKSDLIEKKRSFVAIGSHFTTIEWGYLKKLGVFIEPSVMHHRPDVEPYNVNPRVDMNVNLLIETMERLASKTNWGMAGAQVADRFLQGISAGEVQKSAGARTDV